MGSTKKLLKGIGQAILATVIIPTAIDLGTKAAKRYADKLQKKNRVTIRLSHVGGLALQEEADPA